MAMAAGEHILGVDSQGTFRNMRIRGVAALRGEVEFAMCGFITLACRSPRPVPCSAGQSLAIVGHTGAGKTPSI
jgi:ABC-type multidrug transport system fused ATPase/permease subunit